MSATIVPVNAAAANLSHLLDRVGQGEEIVISVAGHPVARLTSLAPRRPGGWRGRVHTSSDFDAVPPEITKALHAEQPAASC